mmetsp:Transcript_6593/g.24594  ORF Transcript_6593/g.24594 Transcript_6593/m.24594 type:complete len:118 (-) Transcript_6593:40-393(-)
MSFSLEHSLTRTSQWLKELGMDDQEVAKTFARFPPLLGLNLAKNLKVKVQAIRDRGFADSQLVSLLLSFPRLFGSRLDLLTHRMDVLAAQGLLAEQSLRHTITLTEAKFAARFESAA